MEIKELIEMRDRWATDKHKLRMMAHGRNMPRPIAPGVDELWRTANLLNEAEILLGKAILEVSAKTD